MPIPPAISWTFLDVTNRPEAQVGMLYDAETDTFSPASKPPPSAVFPSPMETKLDSIEKMLKTLLKDKD